MNLRIVERHADEAAFLWARRDRAVRSPLFDLESLAEIDGRLDANLEGLIIAGERGLAAVKDALERTERSTSDIEGEVFTAAHVAAELGDLMAFAKLLVFAEKRLRSLRPLVSALAWLSAGTASRVLSEMSQGGGPPWLQSLALAAYAARREDPGDALLRALASGESMVRSRVFRTVGEFGRRDLLRELRCEVRAGDRDSWAEWSAALLGDSDAAEVLWDRAEAGDLFAQVASAMAARVSTAEAAESRLLALSRVPGGLPAALAGAAARGDPGCIPWVLAVISAHPEAAHRAAWVYATITGAELSPPLAVRVSSAAVGVRDLIDMRADAHRDLPSPDIEAIAGHWAGIRNSFPIGERFLGGRRLDVAWLETCLRAGRQPWRFSAATELVRQGVRSTLFPVRAPARVQVAHLGGEAESARV